MKFTYCLRIVFVNRKCTDILGGAVIDVDFYVENLLGGGKFLGVNTPGEILHWGI